MTEGSKNYCYECPVQNWKYISGDCNCLGTCPIVILTEENKKLNERVDKQQAEIRNLQQPNVIAMEVVEKYIEVKKEVKDLKEELEAIKKS